MLQRFFDAWHGLAQSVALEVSREPGRIAARLERPPTFNANDPRLVAAEEAYQQTLERLRQRQRQSTALVDAVVNAFFGLVFNRKTGMLAVNTLGLALFLAWGLGFDVAKILNWFKALLGLWFYWVLPR